MSLELTENKSNIGSGALNDLVFILYCHVIGQWLPTMQSAISWRSVGERSATDWRSVGDWVLGVCFWLQKVCNFLDIGRQPIDDWSAISRRLKTVSDCLQPLQLVGDQSPTSRQPVGDHQKPFYDGFGRREVSLAANKTFLWPNCPCNLLQPVGYQSPTSLQPPCDHPKFWSQGGRRLVASYVWPGLKGPNCLPGNPQRLKKPYYYWSKLEQLERLHSEDTPATSWLPIPLSHIGSKVKRRQIQSKEFAKISNF